MKSLFITATNTDIGKTYTSLKLIEAFSKKGILVGICKPIETGVRTEPIDAKTLLESVQKYNKNFLPLKAEDITAYTFSLPAAPFCADLKNMIKIETIERKVKELEKLCDLLIIEGAGGLFVPITSNYYMIDLIEALNVETLLVTPSKLGCINDTLLSIEALKNRNISFNWSVNLYQDRENFKKVTQPFYDEVFPKWWSFDSGVDRFVSNYIERFSDGV